MNTDTTILNGVSVVELGESVAAGSAGAVLRKLGAAVRRLTAPEITGRTLAVSERRLLDILSAGTDVVRVEAADAIVAQAAAADIVICDVSDSGFAAGDAAIASYLAEVGRRNRSSWVTVSPFGLHGPLAGYRGGELIATAAGGVSAYMRSSRGRPMKPAGFPSLVTAGHFAALAGLHGLHQRRRTGQSAHADLSIQETVVVSGTFLECAHLLFDCPGRGGTSRYSAPKGIARCRDGLILIVIIEDHQWRRLKSVLGEPEWARGIVSRVDRQEQSPLIQRRFEEWTGQRTVAECLDLLQGAGVPVTAVSSCADLLADQDLRRRGFFAELADGTRVPHLPASVRFRQEARAGAGDGGRRPRIVDLSNVLAGPLATSWLGAMGLDVVKVEDPGRVDVYRRGGPFVDAIEDPERSVYFAAANYSKRSVSIDLSTPSGLRELGEIACAADYVVENLSSARAVKLLPPELRSVMPGAVVSSSGFGRVDSGRAGWRAYGHNIHAQGGLVDLSRDRDNAPRDLGTSWGDPLTGVWIALFVMAATTPGARQRPDIDLSMVEVVAAEFPDFFVRTQESGETARALESRSEGFAPHGIFTCAGADSWLALAVSNDEQFAALVAELGSPKELLTNEFQTAVGREAAQDALDAALDAVLVRHQAEVLFPRLQAVGVACVPVLTARALIDHPHLAAREFFQYVRHPVWGERRLTGLPWRSVGGGTIALGPPPLFGQHSDEVTNEWLGSPIPVFVRVTAD